MEKEKLVAMIVRNVPLSTRRRLKAKAALEGKPVNKVVLELITQYISGPIDRRLSDLPEGKAVDCNIITWPPDESDLGQEH